MCYHVQLFLNFWAVGHQAPLSMGFSRQEYWSRLPCPPPGDLPDPGIKPESLMLPTEAGRFFTIGPPGKSEGLVTQSCLTLCDPVDCSPPGSAVHGIFQARILELVAILFSSVSSQPRDWIWVFCIGSWVLYLLDHQGSPKRKPTVALICGQVALHHHALQKQWLRAVSLESEDLNPPRCLFLALYHGPFTFLCTSVCSVASVVSECMQPYGL